MSSATPDARANQSVTARECDAMRLLAADGWTKGVLKMCFMIPTGSVTLHVTGECSHRGSIDPTDVDPNPMNSYR